MFLVAKNHLPCIVHGWEIFCHAAGTNNVTVVWKHNIYILLHEKLLM
jgi:hypothetical protein